MKFNDETKNERKSLYFDLICGVICSSSALIGITVITFMHEITNKTGWIAGLTFWITYLVLSLVLVFFGLYTRWKDKHFDDQPPRKDLKPPIV